jgi:hypothetical protein
VAVFDTTVLSLLLPLLPLLPLMPLLPYSTDCFHVLGVDRSNSLPSLFVLLSLMMLFYSATLLLLLLLLLLLCCSLLLRRRSICCPSLPRFVVDQPTDIATHSHAIPPTSRIKRTTLTPMQCNPCSSHHTATGTREYHATSSTWSTYGLMANMV